MEGGRELGVAATTIDFVAVGVVEPAAVNEAPGEDAPDVEGKVGGALPLMLLVAVL